MLKKGATLNIGFDWTRTQGYKNALPWKNAHVHPNTGFGVANLNSLDTTSAFTFRTEKWEGHNTNHNDWRVYTGKVSSKTTRVTRAVAPHQYPLEASSELPFMLTTVHSDLM